MRESMVKNKSKILMRKLNNVEARIIENRLIKIIRGVIPLRYFVMKKTIHLGYEIVKRVVVRCTLFGSRSKIMWFSWRSNLH